MERSAGKARITTVTRCRAPLLWSVGSNVDCVCVCVRVCVPCVGKLQRCERGWHPVVLDGVGPVASLCACSLSA